MRNITKKIIIYSMVGMMQLGFGASILEASPRDDWNKHNKQKVQEEQRHKQEMKRYDKESDRDWNDRQWRENQRYDKYCRQENERQYRYDLERQRHERAMQRWENERWQDWNDRQWRENQRHEQLVRDIEVDLIRLFLDM